MVATTEDLQDLVPGEYSVTVTGTGGCSTADTFTVPEVGSSFSLSGIKTANTNCVTPNGSIDLTVSPAGTIHTSGQMDQHHKIREA